MYQGSQTSQSQACTNTYDIYLVCHLSGLSDRAPHHDGLDVPMDSILKNTGQCEEKEGGHEHLGQLPGTFREVPWFILRADRDTGSAVDNVPSDGRTSGLV